MTTSRAQQRPCRAKNPATCRVHGRATVPQIRTTLDRVLAEVLHDLQVAVTTAAPTYVAQGGFANRLTQFNDRLDRAAHDLHTFPDRTHITGQALTVENIGGEMTHNLAPVIGWLHTDLHAAVGGDVYTTSDVRRKVDAVYARVNAVKQQIADLTLPQVTAPAAKH